MSITIGASISPRKNNDRRNQQVRMHTLRDAQSVAFPRPRLVSRKGYRVLRGITQHEAMVRLPWF